MKFDDLFERKNNMAYTVAKYYIGPLARYDGTGNTDTASIHLFKEKEMAIQFILKQIQEDIDNMNTNDNKTDEPYIFADMENFMKNIKEHGMYNHEDTIMYTVEFLEIK